MEKIKILFMNYNPQDIREKEELRESSRVSRKMDLGNQ